MALAPLVAASVALPGLLITPATERPPISGARPVLKVVAQTRRHGVVVAPGLIAEGGAMAVRLAHSKRPAAAARGPATLKASASP